MKRNFLLVVYVSLFTLVSFSVSAQETLTLKQIDSLVDAKISQREKQNEEKIGKPSKIKLTGMIQTRYIQGLTPNVELSGLHNPDDSKVVSNSFDVRRFRFGGKFDVDEKIEVGFLANFADFKSNPLTKFLENAFLKYKHNKYFNFTMGQFRVSFGLENSYASEVCRSFDYSNMYYESGLNGWQSFQIGAAITGEAGIGTNTLFYSVSVVNGNGKNAVFDSNDGKLYESHLQLELSKKHNFRIGWSGGVGREKEQQTWVLGAEVKGDIPLAKDFVLEMQAEARQGVNHYLYSKIKDPVYSMENYQMRGVYVLPNLRYFTNQRYLNSVEFSCRYEYLDSNFKVNSNYRNSYNPMLSLEFLKEYAARICTGMQIDNYETNIPETTTYDSKMYILQLQARF